MKLLRPAQQPYNADQPDRGGRLVREIKEPFDPAGLESLKLNATTSMESASFACATEDVQSATTGVTSDPVLRVRARPNEAGAEAGLISASTLAISESGGVSHRSSITSSLSSTSKSHSLTSSFVSATAVSGPRWALPAESNVLQSDYHLAEVVIKCLNYNVRA
ncbi:unnamed protein product [Protopolystoma xenopodis]|uniref:Uncharacterized protein n=1 Tax=Protopolystoma xenopodis TaxID=117903 RepID=A0A448WLP6_9PLAT|nr:unnamed protein product [Protopolystoma xenopodis]